MENIDVVSAIDFYLEKAFYIFGFIMLGMAWLTFRAGSTYHHFKNADKLVREGRGSFSNGEGPEVIRRLKFQTLTMVKKSFISILVNLISTIV